MKKRAMASVAGLGMLLLASNGANAAPPDDLAGSYSFQTTGSGVVSGATSGECLVFGTVPAALTDGRLSIDGRGGISGNVGISIGATTCSAVNYSITGNYTIQKQAGKAIDAIGVLTMTFQGRPAACGGTFLVSQPFTLLATLNGKQTSFTLDTVGSGDGSVYAEASNNAGPLDCTAKILNFVTSGLGKRQGN